MPPAGLLLTGGASRRMGRDKAALSMADVLGADHPDDAGGAPERLSERTGRLLAAAVAPAPALEVGAGGSGLAVAAEADPGRGPLTALVAGASALGAQGWPGGAVVVATDLPLLSASFLDWLVAHPFPGSVVPVSGGRPQPLCARWSAPDLATAAALVGAGARSMQALLTATRPLLVTEDGWAGPAGGAACLLDVDSPTDLDALRRRVASR